MGPNRNFKNLRFLDLMISCVLCDLPFSKNQPLILADDLSIRILKSEINNLVCLR